MEYVVELVERRHQDVQYEMANAARPETKIFVIRDTRTLGMLRRKVSRRVSSAACICLPTYNVDEIMENSSRSKAITKISGMLRRLL